MKTMSLFNETKLPLNEEKTTSNGNHNRRRVHTYIDGIIPESDINFERYKRKLTKQRNNNNIKSRQYKIKIKSVEEDKFLQLFHDFHKICIQISNKNRDDQFFRIMLTNLYNKSKDSSLNSTDKQQLTKKTYDLISTHFNFILDSTNNKFVIKNKEFNDKYNNNNINGLKTNSNYNFKSNKVSTKQLLNLNKHPLSILIVKFTNFFHAYDNIFVSYIIMI